MNLISTRQNEPQSIEKLAAQRQLYSEAKLLYGAQLIASGPVAVALALLIMLRPEAKQFGALWSLLLIIANTFLITPLVKKRRTSGAIAQEMFDCYVLDLPWSKIKVGAPLEYETIKRQALKLKNRKPNMPSLKNWYAPRVSELSLDLGRLACQRTNCWWDGSQRRIYASVIAGSSIGITVALLFFALVMKLSLADLLVSVVVPVSPMLALATAQYMEQSDVLSKLDSVKSHCEVAWSDALKNRGVGDVSVARSIQDEIFETRKRSPLVFDFIFKRIRGGNEKVMKSGISDLIRQAQDSGSQ